MTTPFEMIRLLSSFVRGGETRIGPAADFINYAVVQPMLNPAFASLFWLGLKCQLRPEENAEKLGDTVGELALDLSWFPASKAEARQVRAAQVPFVREKFKPKLETTWFDANDEDWAAQCSEVMCSREADVDAVFAPIQFEADWARAHGKDY